MKKMQPSKSIRTWGLTLSIAAMLSVPLFVFSCQSTRLSFPKNNAESLPARSALTYANEGSYNQSPLLFFTADTGLRDDENQPHPDALLVRDLGQAICSGRCQAGAFLGDNIYPSGLADTQDRQYFRRFLSAYSSSGSGFLTRSYFSLGNHDWGPLSLSRKRAQNFLYAISESSELGALGKAHFFRAKEGTFGLVNLDSNYFVRSCSAQFESDETRKRAEAEVTEALNSPFAHAQVTCPGEENAQELPLSAERIREIYREGCSELSAESACRDQTITIAHHPWWSNGAHGSAGRYRDGHHFSMGDGQAYRALLEAEVRPHSFLYLSGHDHGVHVHLDPKEPSTLSIVVGSGAKVTPAGKETQQGSQYHQPNMVSEAFCRLGFATAEAQNTKTVVKVYSFKGSQYESCQKKSQKDERATTHDLGQKVDSKLLPTKFSDLDVDFRCHQYSYEKTPEDKSKTWRHSSTCQ